MDKLGSSKQYLPFYIAALLQLCIADHHWQQMARIHFPEEKQTQFKIQVQTHSRWVVKKGHTTHFKTPRASVYQAHRKHGQVSYMLRRFYSMSIVSKWSSFLQAFQILDM